MSIAIHSFDFDGCLSWRENGLGVIQDNLALLTKIINENKDKLHNYVFIGSLRQSFYIDSMKALHNGNGSCVPEILNIVSYLEKELKVSLVPLLLADIYGKLELGTSFQRIQRTELVTPLDQKLDLAAGILMDIWNEQQTPYSPTVFNLSPDTPVTLETIKQSLENTIITKKIPVTHYLFDRLLLDGINENLRNAGWLGSLSKLYKQKFETIDHSDSYIDRSKVSIVYAQMHERASALAQIHPNESFEFNFYDDSGEIIDDLNRFYTEFRHLIPKNMVLRLHSYSGTVTEPCHEIQGKGAVDDNYAKTVRKFTRLALTEPKENYLQKLIIARSEKLLIRLRAMPKDDTFATVFNQPYKQEIDFEFKTKPAENITFQASELRKTTKEMSLGPSFNANFTLKCFAAASALLIAVGLIMACWPESSPLVAAIGGGLAFFGGVTEAESLIGLAAQSNFCGLIN